jgi:thiamine biosynthesis lipoprotein
MAGVAAAAGSVAEMQSYAFSAMNTDVVLLAQGNPAEMAEAFSRAEALVRAYEVRFTRFNPSSELSQLNAKAGSWFQASDEMFEVLSLAQCYAAATDGLFNPAVLPAMIRIGYDRSLELVRQYGAAPSSEAPKPAPDFSAVELDADRQRVILPSGMQLDLGGIAKGWIAEQAARLLAEIASACAVNAGGDMALIGLPPGQPAWEIELEDPRNPQATLGILNVTAGGVATSSIGKRRWHQSGLEQHHLIDPRSGAPAEAEWLSVTTVAGRAVTAEVYAKALLLAGPRRAAEMLLLEPDLRYVAAGKDGEIWVEARNPEVGIDAVFVE